MLSAAATRSVTTAMRIRRGRGSRTIGCRSVTSVPPIWVVAILVRSGRGAGSTVQGEGAGIGVAAAEAGLEAEGGGAAGRDDAVPASISGADHLAGLRRDGVPGVGDLLVAAEGPRERPAVHRGAAGVADGDVGDEAG